MKSRRDDKTKFRYFIIFCVLFLILYVIIAQRHQKTELQLKPEWTIHLDKVREGNNSSIAADEPRYPFRLQDSIGYFTKDGKIASLHQTVSKSAISESYWTVFQEDAKDTPIFDKSGAIVGTINAKGFPFFQDSRIFLFAPGGNSISQYSKDGKELWHYEGFNPITAFDSSETNCVIGYADGEIVCIRKDGIKSYSFYPGGSTYSAIFGVAVSSSGKYTASVSGVDKQRFILSQLHDGQHKVIYHEYLPGRISEQTFVKFTKDERIVFFNYDKGLGILDRKALKTTHLEMPEEEKIVSITETSVDNIVLALSKNNRGKYFVYIIENYSNLIGKLDFEAEKSFITNDDEAFYLGKDDTISKFLMERK